jgi:hypothetical protein
MQIYFLIERNDDLLEPVFTEVKTDVRRGRGNNNGGLRSRRGLSIFSLIK